MRRRRWIRRIGGLFGTVALGGLLGFLVPTIVTEYAPPQSAASNEALPIPTAATELPIARRFINAFVVNDQEKLRALGADETDTVKANDLANQASMISTPVLLGSVGGPGASLQAYASNVTMNDGTQKILSWRVLTSSGRATLILPPLALGNAP
jgi:hypothetical protein